MTVPLVPMMSTGGTDGIYFGAIGIPSYGPPGLYGDPDGNDGHGGKGIAKMTSIVVVPRIGVVIGCEGHAIAICGQGIRSGCQIVFEVTHIGLTFGNFFQESLQISYRYVVQQHGKTHANVVRTYLTVNLEKPSKAWMYRIVF